MNYFDGIRFTAPSAELPAVDDLDPRPRLVLVVGNGFSLGWVSAVAKPCSVNIGQLYPQPNTVHYRPYPFDDQFASEPLSSGKLFPQLHGKFSACNSEDESRKIYRRMLIEIANEPGFSEFSNKLVIKPRSLSTEFRMHTWNAISHFQDEFAIANLAKGDSVDALQNPVHWWSWPRVFRAMAQEFRVTIVSFNYDTLVQDIYTWSVNEPTVEPADQCRMWLRAVKGRQAVVLKPHGGVNWMFAPGIAMNPHFWLDDTCYTWSHCAGMLAVRSNPGRESSGFPVIVPPGCGIEHMVYAGTDLIDATRMAFQEADAIVSVGFRAAPPDDGEVQDFLNETKRSCVGICVGLPNDEHNEMSEMLRERCGKFVFLRADSSDGSGEVATIPEVLDREIIRQTPISSPLS